MLELQEDYFNNFHIRFLIGLSKYLGFYPNNNYNNNYFDLIDGSFKDYMPSHIHYLDKKQSEMLNSFISKSTKQNIPISAERRITFLEKLIEYYKIHIDGFGDIKSLYIFNNLFHT